jgi:hypothetical protein
MMPTLRVAAAMQALSTFLCWIFFRKVLPPKEMVYVDGQPPTH